MAKTDAAVLIDSVILIDHFNGIPAATEYLLRMQGKLAISVITFAEHVILTIFHRSVTGLSQFHTLSEHVTRKQASDPLHRHSWHVG